MPFELSENSIQKSVKLITTVQHILNKRELWTNERKMNDTQVGLAEKRFPTNDLHKKLKIPLYQSIQEIMLKNSCVC